MTEISDEETVNSFENRFIRLPVLDGMSNTGEKILTGNELVDQTADFMESFGEQIENSQTPDSIFFLLKSATPIALMFKKLWPTLYPDAPMPAIRYVNVGRKDRSEIVYHMSPKTYEIKSDYIGPTIKAPDVGVVRNQYSGNIDTSGRILIVDEWSESGGTVEAARALFSEAFPEAEVDTKIVYSKLPHWFEQPSYIGMEESDIWTSEDHALERINKQFGTNFVTDQDMMGDARSTMFRKLFLEYVDKLEQSPYGVVTPHDFDKGIFDTARKEQEIICNEVLKRIQRKRQNKPAGK